MPKTAPTSKTALKDELLDLLARELETSERAQRDAHAGAIHEEAQAEDDKDTRAIEQSYLARGQAARAEALSESITAIKAMAVHAFKPHDPIAVGALVTVEDEDDEEQLFLFVAPHGGGYKLAKGKVFVATPSSPLGEALIGRHVGEVIEVPRAGKARELSILKLS